MKIAIEGCAHGELEKIYDTIAEIEKRDEYKVDLLLCCGDFQATRNLNDLNCMAIPKKFHDMCSFYKYYSGERVAPILTIFIGGNHEASNYLQELPYGGWVAPNMYYLGYAGVVNVNGIRIAGISGIYKGYDFYKGHFEYSPYDESTKRSVYRVRQLEVFRLKQISSTVDICMSHDWPRGVYNFGNSKQLCRFKPHFADEIAENKLGSPPCNELLNHLQPKYWFSAHLHCKFSAIIPHEIKNGETNDAELKFTKFLALDKCLPKRQFLQILDIDDGVKNEGDNNDESQNKKLHLSYDLEWLTILSLTNHLLNVKSTTNYMPGSGSPYRWNFTPTNEEKENILLKFDNNLTIPDNFQKTIEPFNKNEPTQFSDQPQAQLNPQTIDFCDKLEIDDPISLVMIMNGKGLNYSTYRDAAEISNTTNESYSSLLQSSNSDNSFNTTDELTPNKRTEFVLPEPKYNSENNDTNIDNPDELSLEESDNIDDEQQQTHTNDSDPDLLNESSLLIDPNLSDLNSTASDSFTHISFSPPPYKSKNDASLSDSVTNMLKETVNITSPNISLVETNPKKSPRVDEDVNDPETTKSPPKKFKRRNQAIYGLNLDESTE